MGKPLRTYSLFKYTVRARKEAVNSTFGVETAGHLQGSRKTEGANVHVA